MWEGDTWVTVRGGVAVAGGAYVPPVPGIPVGGAWVGGAALVPPLPDPGGVFVSGGAASPR